MAFCVQCGSDLLVDEARFCPLCGAPQPRLGRQTGAEHESPPDAAAPAAAGAPGGAEAPLSDLDLPIYPDDTALPAPRGAPDEAGGLAGVVASRAEPTVAVTPAQAGPRAPTAYLWRLTLGDRLAAGGSLVLLVSLFLTWFTGTIRVPAIGHNFIRASARTDAVGAGGWRWLMVLLAIGIFVYVALRTLPGESVRLPIPHKQILGLATGIQLALALLSLLLPPTIGSWTPAYGAIIGVLAAAVAAAGAYLRRNDLEVITERPPAGARQLRPPRPPRPERAPKPERPPRTERRRGRDAVTVVVSENDPVPSGWNASLPAGGPADSGAGPVEAAPPSGRGARRVAQTQEYHVTGSNPPGTRPGSRPAAPPPPAQAAATAGHEPYGPDTAAQPVRRPTSRPVDPGDGGAVSEVVCAICGTSNTVAAKVCRTCGVVLVPRSERT